MASIDPTNLFGFLIQDIARLMSRTYENQDGDSKVTRAQARVLAYVSLSEGSSQSDVAARMDVQKITLTKLVDGLEEMNLVERRPDPADRRIRRLYMAANARPILKDIWRRLSDVSDIALAAIPESRRQNFVDDMNSVRLHLIENNEMSLEHRQPGTDHVSAITETSSVIRKAKK